MFPSQWPFQTLSLLKEEGHLLNLLEQTRQYLLTGKTQDENYFMGSIKRNDVFEM